MLLTVLLPPSADEPLIRTLMQEVDEACGKLNIQIMGGHTEITAVVNQPVISVTGVGKVQKDKLVTTGGAMWAMISLRRNGSVSRELLLLPEKKKRSC